MLEAHVCNPAKNKEKKRKRELQAQNYIGNFYPTFKEDIRLILLYKFFPEVEEREYT
jgi:hypothetical protein